MKFPHPSSECFYHVLCLCFCVAALAFPLVWFVTAENADPLVRLVSVLFWPILLWRFAQIKDDAAVWLALLSLIILVSGYVWQINTVPEELFGGSSARRYFVIFFFSVFLAYATILWRPLSPFLLLIGAALGGVLYLAIHAPSEDWVKAWAGQRVAYGFWNAQYAGVLFGSGLLGISFFAPRILRSVQASTRTRGIGALLIAAFFSLMLWGAITTQVRAVWLGLVIAVIVVVIPALVLSVFASNRGRVFRMRSWAWMLAVVMLGVTLAVVIGVNERIGNRLAAEEISVQTLRDASEFDADRFTSSGVRVASWVASIDWIKERPLLGWGGQSAKWLIRADERFDESFRQRYGHLHNSYLEALVAVGFLGVMPWIGLAALIGWRSVQAWRSGGMPTDAFLFAWAFFVYWLVVNAFESYINSGTGLYLTSVVGGWAYAFHLRSRQVQTMRP